MNIFKSSTFTWYQLGALKWTAFLIGIVVGAKWAYLFTAHLVSIFIVGVALGLYVTVVWLKK